MEIIGVGILVIAWALQVAWIAGSARDRGRSVLVWAVIGGAAGIAGLAAARELIVRTIEPFGSNTTLLVTITTPIAFLVLPMAGIAVGLRRSPAHAARRATWRVHSAQRGAGQLSIRRDGLAIAWRDGNDDVPFATLK